MYKANWLWQMTGLNGALHGYVEAIDPRDALSRALTSETSSGHLLGQENNIPVDVLNGAPGNADTQYEVSGEGFTIRVQKVACPSNARHSDDVVGCYSTNVAHGQTKSKGQTEKVSYEEMKRLYQQWFANGAAGTQAAFFKNHGGSRVTFFNQASNRGDDV